MFEKNTVIVIGAGASAEFGLPTGQSILDHIAVSQSPAIGTTLHDVTNSYHTFGRSFREYALQQDIAIDENDLSSLLQKASNGYHNSIDLLAVRNPSLVKISKLLCSWTILSRMYAKSTTQTNDYGKKLSRNTYTATYRWRQKR